MPSDAHTTGLESGPTGGDRFGWRRLAVFLPASAVLGVMISWVAVVAERSFAPWILFPILVGIGLGAMIVGAVRVAQLGHRPTVLLGTIIAAAVAVAGQHYAAYRSERDTYDSQIQTFRLAEQAFPEKVQGGLKPPATDPIGFLKEKAAEGRPLPGNYTARGSMAWLTWALDAALVLAAALAMVIPAMRQPYCRRCRSWYRVVRSGRTDVATARRLAELAEIEPVENPVSARYRMVSCNGGCGPTGFELAWDESPRGTSRVRCWLEAALRDRITGVLDEMNKN